MMRSGPSTTASPIGIHVQGALVRGSVVEADGRQWLRVRQPKAGSAGGELADRKAYMLIDGQSLGLGRLMERTGAAGEQAKASGEGDGGRPRCKRNKSPAVFWGILDLKYDA